jgi:hypothetical protein
MRFLGLFLAACTMDPATVPLEDAAAGDRDDPVKLDGGIPDPDAGELDAKQGDADPFMDAEPGVDTADGGDAGVALPEEMVPGSHVQVAEGRIDIGMPFSEVLTRLGPGVRTSAQGARSYEWTLGGVTLTVWPANTNLDDDAPPMDVDGTDRVLWIAVQGFLGSTPEGIRIGSTRSEVEAAYGAAPHTVPIPNPAGTLAQYFVRGILVAYGTDDVARTITIARAYPTAPDGEIDPNDARIRTSAGEIQGIRTIVQLGTDRSDVIARLGEPDGTGSVNLGGQDLDALSYGFIGIEVFFLQGEDRTLFATVHVPYYGTTSGGQGVGSARADVESFLASQGYGGGMASSNPALICYPSNGNDPMVGVTYDSGMAATTFTVPIPLGMCP